LIEKAFAKYVGSYSYLSGGNFLKAVTILTGCEKNIHWVIDSENEIANCKYFDIDMSRQLDIPKHRFIKGGVVKFGRPPFMSDDECKPTVDLTTLFAYLES